VKGLWGRGFIVEKILLRRITLPRSGVEAPNAKIVIIGGRNGLPRILNTAPTGGSQEK
jgi:hypothetical protein